MTRVGVLALQGDFEAHLRALRRVDGVAACPVRRVSELAQLDGLVIPGGESTTLLNLMQDEPWFDAIREFHDAGGSLFGTCAGAILLSRTVENPEQPSLGLLDATIRRNGYGRQVDSFESEIGVAGLASPLCAVFIRAPRFIAVGETVEVLARCRDEPVLVRQGRVLAGTFHPELTGDDRLHALFLRMIEEQGIEENSNRGGSATAPDFVAAERRISC